VSRKYSCEWLLARARFKHICWDLAERQSLHTHTHTHTYKHSFFFCPSSTLKCTVTIQNLHLGNTMVKRDIFFLQNPRGEIRKYQLRGVKKKSKSTATIMREKEIRWFLSIFRWNFCGIGDDDFCFLYSFLVLVCIFGCLAKSSFFSIFFLKFYHNDAFIKKKKLSFFLLLSIVSDEEIAFFLFFFCVCVNSWWRREEVREEEEEEKKKLKTSITGLIITQGKETER